MPRSTPMISYAQNLEDVLLNRVFADVERGLYVDVGAADPLVRSLTAHFYAIGWHGINIEPSTAFAQLAEARPNDVNLELAVSNAPGRMAFIEYPDVPSLSGLAQTQAPSDDPRLARQVRRDVEARPLRDILDEHCSETIQFLSVDVEGHERQVLESNDWSRYRPRVVLVEATLPNTPVPCHDRWEDVLLGAGYFFVYFDGINRYYLRPEDRELVPRFAPPPNTFDNYKLAEVKLLEERLAASEEYARELSELYRELANICEKLHSELARLHAGTGARSLGLGLWVARWASRVGRLPRRLLREGPRRGPGDG